MQNTTYTACQEKEIQCYKLPIQTYMEHSVDGGTYNQILTINQGRRMYVRCRLVIVYDKK
jgi:hypothetical protein